MTLQEQIRANRWRTVVVLLGFAALVAALAAALGLAYDPGLMGIVGIVGIVYGLFSYFSAGGMVAYAAGARPVQKAEAPELYRAVENAAIGAGLQRTPDVYVVDDAAPNAFAAGRTPETAFVAATTGLMQLLDRRELEGVMAHEIAHVRNRDVQLMTIASVMTGVIILVCDMLMRISFHGGRSKEAGIFGLVFGIVAMILAPIAAAMLQMALSRRREFLADASAVEITGDAEGLASALHKLGTDHRPLQKVTRATAHMYIESPLRDQPKLRSSLGGMFNTHPPLAARIGKLCEMGGLAPQQFDLGAADPEALSSGA